MVNKIMEILRKYDAEDVRVFHDTVDMLAARGIPNGCYQDYAVLNDVLTILSICERIIKEG